MSGRSGWASMSGVRKPECPKCLKRGLTRPDRQKRVRCQYCNALFEERTDPAGFVELVW